MAVINAGGFQIIAGGFFTGFAQFFLKSDMDVSGTFDDDEELSSDVTSITWNRGRDSEDGTTPAGSMSFVVKDPNGDYVPDSTVSKWRTSTNDLFTIDREVSLRIVYKDTTFPGFRGRIEKVTPSITPGDQSASIYCVDGFDELGAKTVSVPVGDGLTSAGVTIGTNNGGAIFSRPIGGTTGHIASVLDQSSWPSTRRSLGTSTDDFDYFFAFREPARGIIGQIEHDARASIFVDGNGDVTYQSSTHRTGTTFVNSFDADFQNWDYSVSAKNLRNRAVVSVHTKSAKQTTGAGVPTGSSNGLGDISNGSTFEITFTLDPPVPVSTVVVPEPGSDSLPNRDVGFIGLVTGTTFTGVGGNVLILGQLIGGAAFRVTVINNTTEGLQIVAPNGASDTATTFYITRNELIDAINISEVSDSDSITKHRARTFDEDYPFFARPSTGLSIANEIIDKRASLRPDFTKFTLEASDSNSITQILSREISDKIRITSTALKITNRDYFINSGEWSIQSKSELSVIWALEESS